MRAAALVLALAAAAGAQQWKAGVAKTDITPTEPIWMAGYGARNHPSEGVRQKLWVKAVALDDGAGHTSVIVAADTIGFPRAMSDEIIRRCGLPRERVVLAASHTHSGPLTGQLGRPGYMLEAQYAPAVKRYTARMLEATADTIRRAVREMSPATVSFGQGFAGFAVNRRRVSNRAWPGPVDQDVPVLAVKSPDGALRAVIAGYACHATVLGDYQIGGDWPGYFKEAFEREHPGAEALFVAGCGADANPLPRRTVDLARKYGEVLAAAVGEVTRGRMTAVAGPVRSLYETVDLPLAARSRKEIEADLQHKNSTRRNNAKQLLSRLEREGKLPASYPYPVQVWSFGGRLTWVVLASEVVVDYSLRLKAAHGWNTTWVSAYANDFCGYIPSLRVLKEGGYEGGEAMASQGHPGPWGDRVEELIVGKVQELVNRVKR